MFQVRSSNELLNERLLKWFELVTREDLMNEVIREATSNMSLIEVEDSIKLNYRSIMSCKNEYYVSGIKPSKRANESSTHELRNDVINPLFHYHYVATKRMHNKKSRNS